MDLLECGVRALDWRPELTVARVAKIPDTPTSNDCTQSGELYMHHGDVLVSVPFRDVMHDVMSWVETHPGELVLVSRQLSY